MPRVTINRTFAPYLLPKALGEEDPSTDDTIELSGDDLADYEETARKFAKWQHRLAEADAL